MRTVSSSRLVSRLSSVLLPTRFFCMRSATCCMSCLRSRRYSSLMPSNCCDRRAVWICSAHSALICCSRIMSAGSRERVASDSSIRCREINAPSSAGAFSGMALRSCSNCLRAALAAASKRAVSAGMSAAAMLYCGTSDMPRTTRCARPMAMPLPAAYPCRTIMLFLFAEAAVDEFAQCG